MFISSRTWRRGLPALLASSWLAAGAARTADAACTPAVGVRGSFPSPGDSNIPVNSRFLFEVASWPQQAKVSFELYLGTTLMPGKWTFLEAIGPKDLPHAQYLYQFIPDGPLEGGQAYHSFLRTTTAGATNEDTLSIVFTAKQETDVTPPEFKGIESLDVIYGAPDRTDQSHGYDCILGEGTFVVALVRFPKSEIKTISPSEERKDGVIFHAYRADGGSVASEVAASSIVWPAAYRNIPDEWYMVLEKDPPPDANRCFVVRATDAAGNEDSNANIKCITAPGPAALAPGAGSKGFFGNAGGNGLCSYGERGGRGLFGLSLVAAALALASSRRRRR